MKEIELRKGEVLVIGDTKIMLNRILKKGTQVRLTFVAPRDVLIMRQELLWQTWRKK